MRQSSLRDPDQISRVKDRRTYGFRILVGLIEQEQQSLRLGQKIRLGFSGLLLFWVPKAGLRSPRENDFDGLVRTCAEVDYPFRWVHQHHARAAMVSAHAGERASSFLLDVWTVKSCFGNAIAVQTSLLTAAALVQENSSVRREIQSSGRSKSLSKSLNSRP